MFTIHIDVTFGTLLENDRTEQNYDLLLRNDRGNEKIKSFVDVIHISAYNYTHTYIYIRVYSDIIIVVFSR